MNVSINAMSWHTHILQKQPLEMLRKEYAFGFSKVENWLNQIHYSTSKIPIKEFIVHTYGFCVTSCGGIF